MVNFLNPPLFTIPSFRNYTKLLSVVDSQSDLLQGLDSNQRPLEHVPSEASSSIICNFFFV